MFADNLNKICKMRGTTLTGVIKEMGLSTSKVSRWNNGALPKEEMMIQLADHLQCSVQDFFSDGNEQLSVNKEPQNDDEADILRIYRSLERRTKHEFMAMVYSFENRG